MRRAKGREYSEKFADDERKQAAKCLADVEKRGAQLLKQLEVLERATASIQSGWLPVHPSPEMIAGDHARAGLRELEIAAQRGDKFSHQKFGFILRDALWRLCFRAQDGDEPAFHTLLAMVDSCLGLLYGLPTKQPEMVKRFAAHRAKWPGFLTVHPAGKKRNTQLLRFLPLGTQMGENCRGKTYSPRTPEVKVARTLVNKLIGHRSSPVKPKYLCRDQQERIIQSVRTMDQTLTPLSRSNYAAWWNTAEQSFFWNSAMILRTGRSSPAFGKGLYRHLRGNFHCAG